MTGNSHVISGLDNGAEYEVQLRGTRHGDTSYRVTNWLKSAWVTVRGTPGQATTARTLTITPSAPSREYGGADDLSYAVSGLDAGDAATDVVAGTLSRAAGENAGSYAFDLSGLSIAAAYAGKYALPAAPSVANYNITARPITAVSGVSVNSRSADGSLTATFDTSAATGTGVLAAELADFRSGGLLVSGSFPAATPGTHSISVTYSLGDSGSFRAANYTLTSTSDTLQGVITRANCGCGSRLALYADGVPAEGGDPVTVVVGLGSPAGAGGVSVTLSAGGTATLGADYTLSPATVSVAAGATAGMATLTVIDDSVDDDDETIVLSASASSLTASTLTLVIADNDSSALTIAPSAPSREYGETDDLSYAVGGLDAGDAATDVVVGTLSRAAGEDAGSYAFDLSGLSIAAAYAHKYALPSAPSVANYTITARPVTAVSGVTVDTRAADGTTAATFDTSAATGAGVLAAELADFRSGGLLVSGSFPAATAGTHSLSVTYSLGDSGTFKADNYTLTSTTDTLQGEITAETTLETPTEDCEPTDLAPFADVSFVADTDLNAVNTNDLTLVSLTLPECATITPEFRPDHYEYTVTVPNHIRRLEVRGRYIDRWTGRQYEYGRFAWVVAGDLAAYEQDRWSYHYMPVANSAGRWGPGRLVGLNPGVTETLEIGLYKWKPGRIRELPYSESTINRAYTLNVTRDERSPGDGAAPQDPAPPAVDDGAPADVSFSVSVFGDYKHLLTIDELTLPPGVSMSPEFRPDHHEYTITVPNHIGRLAFSGSFISQSLRWSGVNRIVVGDLGMWEQRPLANDEMLVHDRRRELTSSGRSIRETRRVEKDRRVTLRPGVAETVEIGLYLHSPNGSHAEQRSLPLRKAYTLTIIREAPPGSDDASLYDMTGSAGYLAFRRDTTTYKLFVTHDLESLVLTPSALHPQATVTVNGEDPVTPVALDYGENLIEVVVTAADGVATQTYEVTVIRSPTNPAPGDFSALIAQIYEWRNDPQSAPSRRWTQYATTITTYATHRAYTDRWDRALLALGVTLPDASLAPMTADEAQTLADQGSAWWRTLQPDWIRTERGKADVRRAWSRWVEVAAALRHVESAQDANPEETRAALIARMYQWRNDPRWVGEKAHTDRWDRALLAFGETVADTTLTPMTAAEAQAFADRGSAWSRWVEVAAALREIEAAEQQQQPTNQAPTVSAAIGDLTIVSESGTHQASLSGVFDDADSDALTVSAASSDEAKATVAVASDYSSLTVTAKARGTATITVTADDGNGGTVDDSFTVTVKAAPVAASALADVSGLEVGATQDVSLSGVFSDADGDSLTITAASSDETKVTVSVAADGSTLTLAGVASGTATVTVTAQDTDGNRVSDAFDVEVVKAPQLQQANRAPTVSSAIADATIVSENGTREVSLSGVFEDADNDALTVTAASSDEAVATASVASDGSSLTVSAQDRGTATITVTADDSNGGTVEDAFTVTVKAAPVVASALSDVSGLEVGATQDVSLSGVFSDADNDSLTVTAASDDEAIATVSVATDGSSLTVGGVAEGTATVTVTAQDTDGNRVSDAFDVEVSAPPPQPNQAPTVSAAIADVTITSESGTKQVSLSGVFSDADNDALTITAASSDDTVATVSVASDGSSLTVTAKIRGTATITVTADDGNGGTVDDAFTVTVKAAPDVASNIGDISGLEAGTTREVSLSGVFSDADGDSLTLAAASDDETIATVSVASDGSALTISGVDEGTATITVTAQDADGNRVRDAFDVEVIKAPEPAPEPETSDIVDRYDANGDGKIDLSEYSQAARDYAAGKITYAEFREVIRAFQGSG